MKLYLKTLVRVFKHSRLSDLLLYYFLFLFTFVCLGLQHRLRFATLLRRVNIYSDCLPGFLYAFNQIQSEFCSALFYFFLHKKIHRDVYKYKYKYTYKYEYKCMFFQCQLLLSTLRMSNALWLIRSLFIYCSYCGPSLSLSPSTDPPHLLLGSITNHFLWLCSFSWLLNFSCPFD